MGWLTATVLSLDRKRGEMERRSRFEERVRLAMWRMDGLLAPLVGTESARPYFWYSAFHPAGHAFTRLFSRVEPGEVLFPSPLLTTRPKHVHVYFQLGPDGKLSSPEVPTGNMRDLAESGYLTHEQIEASAARLAELSGKLDRLALLAILPSGAAEPAEGRAIGAQKRSVQEWQARNMAIQQALDRSVLPGALSPDEVDVNQGAAKPIWLADTLLLVRRVDVGDAAYVQGCMLKWETIEGMLHEQIADLLPGARLLPSREGEELRADRTLASLPVVLEPGNAEGALPAGGTAPRSRLGDAGADGPETSGAGSSDLPGASFSNLPGAGGLERSGPGAPKDSDAFSGTRLSPLRLSLIVGWICLLAAGVGVAWVLSRTMALSERRASFVSAVTHELRTPLTTFRMYTEMLDSGMVQGDEERSRYLATLRSEADRLGHLVQNVLDYARLERGRGGHRVEDVTVLELLGSMRERFAAHLSGVGAQLALEIAPDAAQRRVRVDPAAVERILFNLVDNAAKYASGNPGARLEIRAAAHRSKVSIAVHDNGPGLPPHALKRLFRPFSKSAAQPGDAAPGAGLAGDAAPGVGLGLALSQRLAKRMGGTLTLERGAGPGACFKLTLPCA